MLRDPRRIASFLFASLIGLIAAGAGARAEPAAAAPAATADCLAKPNAPSAPGSHWYYRIDRASGRHCWYQRAVSGASSEANQSRAPSRATASPRADTQLSEPSADMRSEAGDQDTSPPATATTAPPAQPYSWSTEASPPAPAEQKMAPASESAAPSPVVPPQSDAVVVPPRAAPAPAAPIRAQVPAQPAAVVEDGGHIPVILGAAFALFIIVLGSIVARLGAKFIRSRRGGVQRAAVSMPPPILHAQDAPGLVPPMPHEGDITRGARPPRAPRRAPAVRQDRANAGAETAARDRDGARELEENVRGLLRRMRSDLQAAPRTSGAAEKPRPPSAEELDQVLAMWREGRRRPAG